MTVSGPGRGESVEVDAIPSVELRRIVQISPDDDDIQAVPDVEREDLRPMTSSMASEETARTVRWRPSTPLPKGTIRAETRSPGARQLAVAGGQLVVGYIAIAVPENASYGDGVVDGWGGARPGLAAEGNRGQCGSLSSRPSSRCP